MNILWMTWTDNISEIISKKDQGAETKCVSWFSLLFISPLKELGRGIQYCALFVCFMFIYTCVLCYISALLWKFSQQEVGKELADGTFKIRIVLKISVSFHCLMNIVVFFVLILGFRLFIEDILQENHLFRLHITI